MEIIFHMESATGIRVSRGGIASFILMMSPDLKTSWFTYVRTVVV